MCSEKTDYTIIDPPVGPYSPQDEIKSWVAELRGMDQTQADVQASLKEAEGWLHLKRDSDG
jgi:hypothetical protein